MSISDRDRAAVLEHELVEVGDPLQEWGAVSPDTGGAVLAERQNGDRKAADGGVNDPDVAARHRVVDAGLAVDTTSSSDQGPDRPVPGGRDLMRERMPDEFFLEDRGEARGEGLVAVAFGLVDQGP